MNSSVHAFAICHLKVTTDSVKGHRKLRYNEVGTVICYEVDSLGWNASGAKSSTSKQKGI